MIGKANNYQLLTIWPKSNGKRGYPFLIDKTPDSSIIHYKIVSL